MFNQPADLAFEVSEDRFDGAVCIDGDETIFLAQVFKLFYQARLIDAKAIVEVIGAANIHAGFPVIEAPAIDHAGNEGWNFGAQVKHEIGFEGKAIHFACPFRVCAAHNIAPEVELIEAAQINDAYERVLKSDVRYRFVIDAATF